MLYKWVLTPFCTWGTIPISYLDRQLEPRKSPGSPAIHFVNDNPWSILFQNDNPWSILCRLYPLPCKYLGEALHLQKESWGLSVVHGTLWAVANKENNKKTFQWMFLFHIPICCICTGGRDTWKKVGHFQLGAVPFFIPSLIRRVLTVLLKFACTFCAIKNKCSWRYIWRFPELCPFGWKS